MIQVDFCNQSSREVDHRRLILAATRVLEEAELERAQVSLAVIDDPAMHELNRRHLDHDYPTDVLSFVLEQSNGELEGEVIVSIETAESQAREYGWAAEDELLLYVIHGVLHLIGYDDKSPEACEEMRLAETRHLGKFGLTPPWDGEEP